MFRYLDENREGLGSISVDQSASTSLDTFSPKSLLFTCLDKISASGN